MNIGIGYSNILDPLQAGKQVMHMAKQDLASQDVELVLAFCTRHYDQQLFVNGMASELSEKTPIVGGTTIGIINNNVIWYKQPAAAALIFGRNSLGAHVATTELKKNNEEQAGAEIAEKMGCGKNDKFLFMLYNMIKKDKSHHKPPQINSLLSILKGIESVAPSHLPIFGAGSIGDFELTSSTLFSSNKIGPDLLIGVSLCGAFHFDFVVMHGCRPIDGIYRTITKSDGPIILELDGQPAMEVINEIYGSRDWQRDMPVKELTIGVNYGEKFGPYKEEHYVNRLIAAPHFIGKGIITPEPDWQPGTEIQLLVRDNEEMLNSTQERTEALLQTILSNGKKPQLGLYIDCAGRTSYFSNSLQEESSLVQHIFNSYQVPLFGFYSGLEIAPFFQKSRGLEWTGVLIVLSEDRDNT